MLVWWVMAAVALTTLPIMIQILTMVAGKRFRRLVSRWQRPVHLGNVCCLCVVAYYYFWSAVLPYSYRDGPLGSARSLLHVVFISFTWVNAVSAYAACVLLTNGDPTDESAAGRDFPSHYCQMCEAQVACFDHHCPFTGGCIGQRNFRFFIQFVLHAWLGMCDASILAYPPFQECVLSQIESPALGWARIDPPDAGACLKMSVRSLLFIPALSLAGMMGFLASLHLLLLHNGLTTFQLARICQRRGLRGIRDLLLIHLRAEGGDKWALVWGCPSSQAGWGVRCRALLLPSGPLLALKHSLGHRRQMASTAGSQPREAV